MSENAGNRRNDDNEKRTKLELLDEITQSKQRLKEHEALVLAELQAHQKLLEKQNLDLKEAQGQLEKACERYSDLYDFAPVGYITLNEDGHVQEINQTAMILLSQNRTDIIGKSFTNWLSPSESGPFRAHLNQAAASEINVIFETQIQSAGKLRDIRLESSTNHQGSDGTRQCRMAMTDITQSRQFEKHAQELLQENRRLTRRLFNMQELERRHLSRELHDELGQWLTALQADAQTIYQKAMICGACEEIAQNVVRSADQVHHVVRRILRRLRPVTLDQLGLADSLEELVGHWRPHHPDISCELKLEGTLNDLDEVTNITLYRTVQAALTNISSHAGASQVSISLRREPDHILLLVSDNGRGMDMHLPRMGLGLLGMRERAIAANGEFSFTSKPGQGLRIEVKLPLTQSEHEK